MYKSILKCLLPLLVIAHSGLAFADTTEENKQRDAVKQGEDRIMKDAMILPSPSYRAVGKCISLARRINQEEVGTSNDPSSPIILACPNGFTATGGGLAILNASRLRARQMRIIQNRVLANETKGIPANKGYVCQVKNLQHRLRSENTIHNKFQVDYNCYARCCPN